MARGLFFRAEPDTQRIILTCPECTTRYQADAAKFPPSGRDVRCAKCGHVWRQLPPEPEVEAQYAVAEPRAEAPEPEPEAAPEPQSYVQPQIREKLAPQVAAQPRVPRAWPRVAAQVAGWIGLAVVVLALGAAIALYRHQMVSAWPQSASLYAAVGAKTNASGLEVDNLNYHEERRTANRSWRCAARW